MDAATQRPPPSSMPACPAARSRSGRTATSNSMAVSSITPVHTPTGSAADAKRGGQDRIVPCSVTNRTRMKNMKNTLVERHAATDGKNQNGDDQGPEISFHVRKDGLRWAAFCSCEARAKGARRYRYRQANRFLASIAELPVTAPARNLIAAILRFPAIAAITAVLVSDMIRWQLSITVHYRRCDRSRRPNRLRPAGRHPA